ncbi:LuxR family transcriptional regulator [Adlercreutzia sp. R21]|uniref:LuxR family transcriptional regulator n=1 Tax=Adlercreutzia wanghongyangiae TaxID=3111451 RepID=UPI002DB7C655|nr:LuxR family transcriptional regulator [Adlercreutzia sp. R21]MEC4184151.1 LuxR family transcriptional regulator [Adlercreutzia sp. R21]
MAWGLIAVFSNLFAAEGEVNLGSFWLASMVGAPAGLLAFFFFGRETPDERTEQLLDIVAAAAMIFGVLLLEAASGIEGESREPICILAGLVSSFGTAAFTVAWGAQYVKLDMGAIERMAALSLLVSFACYGLVLILPRLAALGVILVLPVLSLLCLRAIRKREEVREDASAPAGDPKVPATFKPGAFTRLGLGIVGTTTVVSLFWGMATQQAIPLPGPVFSASVLSGSVIAVALMAYLSRFSRSLNLGTLYRWMLPLIAVAFSTLLFEGSIVVIVAALLVFATQALLNLITFVYFAELSQRTGASPVRVFGLGRFFVEFGFLIGSLLVPWALQLMPFVAGGYRGVLLIALTFMAMAVMASIASQDRIAFSLADDAQATPADNTIPDTASGGNRADRPLPDADLFQEACVHTAAAFGLTKRESEILPYLAQGYSLPYIRNELYISQSTIDTHVRHIYKKMGLHSKEEVITSVRQTAQQLGRNPR